MTANLRQIMDERQQRLDAEMEARGLEPYGTAADWRGEEAYLYHEAGGPTFARVVGIRADWWIRTVPFGESPRCCMTSSWCCTPCTRLYRRKH